MTAPLPPSAPTTPPKRRGPLFWVAIGAGSLVGLLCLCMGLAGLGAKTSPTPTAIAAQVVAVPPNAPAATEAPEATNAPSATIGPTNTPEPTNTPAPSATPTEAPTATPLPQPVDLSGEGQKVTDAIVLPSALNRIHFTHTGRRNFIVKAYAENGSESYLVNAIGRYDGIRPMLADGPVTFEITADGSWTMHVEALGGQPEAAALSGTGDYTSGVFAPASTKPVPYTFTHTGKRNFIVHLYCAGGEDIIQNEIGAVQNEAIVRASEGPCFWEVQADGDWTLGPK